MSAIQLVDTSFHRVRRRRIVGAHMRCGGDAGNPVLGRRPEDLDALCERAGAVVDAGQNVRVQIDHQTAAYADRAAATRVHRSTLPAAAMRERRNEWL